MTQRLKRLNDLWMRRRTLAVVVVLLAASAAVYGVAHFSTKSPTVATFQVKRGEFLDVLEFRGELKAMKSVTLPRPPTQGICRFSRLRRTARR
jgi:hypothetical protein